MEQAVEHGMSLRDKDKVYEHLCVDEKSYQKCHRYGSILYDEDGTVIDVVEGRSKESVRNLFAGCLTPRQRNSKETTYAVGDSY
jgi:transposase